MKLRRWEVIEQIGDSPPYRKRFWTKRGAISYAHWQTLTAEGRQPWMTPVPSHLTPLWRVSVARR